MIATLRYFPAKLVAVRHLPQMGLQSRAAPDDLGDRKRVIRTPSSRCRPSVRA
ncbi:MAG: hypothetical protein KGZ77_10990 [Rhodobacteraceae bacterium]|nr:hypothetical protein [Paracoccaceae bacterium]